MSPPRSAFPGDGSGLAVTQADQQTVPGRREKPPAPSPSSGRCSALSRASSVPLPGFGDKGGDSQAPGVRTPCRRGAGAPEEAKILGEDSHELHEKGALESPRGEGRRGQRHRLRVPRTKVLFCKQPGSPAAAPGTSPWPSPPPPDGCAETGNNRLALAAPGLFPPPICSPSREKMGDWSHTRAPADAAG